jgi:hypothetical protein
VGFEVVAPISKKTSEICITNFKKKELYKKEKIIKF